MTLINIISIESALMKNLSHKIYLYRQNINKYNCHRLFKKKCYKIYNALFVCHFIVYILKESRLRKFYILQSILQLSLRLQWFVLFMSPSKLDFNVRNFCNLKVENFYKISLKQIKICFLNFYQKA
jgi:hypothetical protein